MTKNIKKIIGLLFCLVFCTVLSVGVPQKARATEEVAIDETNFPDEIFRNYVTSQFDSDGNKKLSEQEIAGIINISIFSEEIKELNGIEYFTALTYLDCEDNQLNSLDVSHNTALTYLNCGYNQLSSLDITNNIALTELWCRGNQLTSLNVSHNTALEELWCSSNRLSNLDVNSNIALIYLDCGYNQLSSLNVNNNIVLAKLLCDGNQLNNLNLDNNVDLTRLWCSNNQLSSLNVSNNTNLTDLRCSNNQLKELKLSDQTYNTLSLYKGYLHGTNVNLTDLKNVTEKETNDTSTVSLIKVIDITKPTTYKVDGKEFTIIYLDTVMLPSSTPSAAPSVTSSPIPSVAPSESPSPGPVAPFDAHIFSDYNYTSPVTDDAPVIYGNGKTQTIDGKKVNNKVCTVYTDILASYKYTPNSNGTVKSSVGKVIVGITKSDTKPEVSSKNKITDISASKIARAKIKNGQITVTSVGKEGGTVYLWVIDTGNKGVSACCPIDVKLAPTKLEIQNTSGSKLTKNTKLQNSKTLDVCIAGLVGTAKTQDCTYTAEVTSKYKNYVEVVPVEGSSNKFTINAKRLKNNKDTKVTVTFKCDQNGKKANLSLTITK